MKNILVYLMLAATFLLSACDKDEKMLEPSYLPVTYANIAVTSFAHFNSIPFRKLPSTCNVGIGDGKIRWFDYQRHLRPRCRLLE